MAQLFPPTGLKEDSQYFRLGRKDNTLRSETDGGYEYTRPRHARNIRRTFNTGFTDLNQSQWNLLDTFIQEHGAHTIFSYQIPTTGEFIDVRFDDIPQADYKGYGGNHRYNITSIKLTEV